MKSKFFSLFSLLLTGGFLSAQMPGMMTMQQATVPQGTTLGANTTSGAAGIALGNRVVMRGYVDFIFKYDDEDGGAQTEAFNTAADIDFLFDFYGSRAIYSFFGMMAVHECNRNGFSRIGHTLLIWGCNTDENDHRRSFCKGSTAPRY